MHDQDASLETIDLNDDPNDQTLERFLRGKIFYSAHDYIDSRLITITLTYYVKIHRNDLHYYNI